MNKVARAIILDIKSNGTGKLYRFGLVAHQVLTVEDLRLPVAFYAGNKLQFPHYEVEIVEPHFTRGQTGKLNYHFSDKDGRAYVCYPKRITEYELSSVLSVWAVGQVCVLKFDRYLNEMIQEAGGPDRFLAWAKSKYGIRVIHEIVA